MMFDDSHHITSCDKVVVSPYQRDMSRALLFAPRSQRETGEVRAGAARSANHRRIGFGATQLINCSRPYHTPTCRTAAAAAKNARKRVLCPVDPVSTVVATLRNQANVFGRGMPIDNQRPCETRPDSRYPCVASCLLFVEGRCRPAQYQHSATTTMSELGRAASSSAQALHAAAQCGGAKSKSRS